MGDGIGALFSFAGRTLPGAAGQIVKMLADAATPVALFTLFVHPLLVLAAALPSASNVSLLAERYEADNGRVARIIMTSTVLAFASFSALAWVLSARPAA